MSDIDFDTNEAEQPCISLADNEPVETILNQHPHAAAKMIGFKIINETRAARFEKLLVESTEKIPLIVLDLQTTKAHRELQTRQMAKDPPGNAEFHQEIDKQIDRAKTRQRKAQAELTGLRSSKGDLFQPCIKMIDENRAATFVDAREYPVVPPGSTATAEFKKTNFEIVQTQAEMLDAMDSSRPIKEIRAEAIVGIDKAADEGKPIVKHSFKPRGAGRQQTRTGAYGRIQFETVYVNGRESVDIEKAFFYFNREQIKAQVLAQIDEEFDPSKVLSAEDRAAKIEACTARILRLDRIAEGFLDLAAAQGITNLVRRPGVNLLAVLGLAIEK